MIRCHLSAHCQKELKISALTVKKAYDTLESEGFTVTVHGKGTYVAATNTELLLEEQKKGAGTRLGTSNSKKGDVAGLVMKR